MTNKISVKDCGKFGYSYSFGKSPCGHYAIVYFGKVELATVGQRDDVEALVQVDTDILTDDNTRIHIYKVQGLHGKLPIDAIDIAAQELYHRTLTGEYQPVELWTVESV